MEQFMTDLQLKAFIRGLYRQLVELKECDDQEKAAKKLDGILEDLKADLDE